MEHPKTIFDSMVVEESNALLKFKNDDVLVLETVKAVENKEFSWKDGSTGIRKVYTMVDGRQYVVPVTLHKMIWSVRKEYGTKIAAIKVKVAGTGLETRYSVLPVIT